VAAVRSSVRDLPPPFLVVDPLRHGIDMPGDPNPSVPRALMTPPASCAAWLDELLAQLSDRPAHLVGLSYGGWVAMNQTIRAPGRVASTTLLDPAGLTSLDARFWLWFSISGLASLTPMPLRRRLARWLDSPSMAEPELMTLMWAGIRGYRMAAARNVRFALATTAALGSAAISRCAACRSAAKWSFPPSR